MDVIQTHGSRIHTQDTMAHMDPYIQATIQVDPRLLNPMLSGRRAAKELSSIDPSGKLLSVFPWRQSIYGD